MESDWEFEGGAAAMHQRSVGLHVPQDMALAGYDNRDFSRIFHPKLTTVSLPAYHMGQKAAELLWQKLQGELTDLAEVKICGQLYIRASCGAAVALQTQDKLDVGTTARHRLTGKQPERD